MPHGRSGVSRKAGEELTIQLIKERIKLEKEYKHKQYLEGFQHALEIVKEHFRGGGDAGVAASVE